jgi:hypothetical protein
MAAACFQMINQFLHIPRYRQVIGPGDEECMGCLREIPGLA